MTYHFFGGLPLCVDATMVGVLHRDGRPWRGADQSDGLRLRAARRRKEITYPELVGSGRAKLLVLSCELGGRWSPEALGLLRQLAWHRSQRSTSLLRKSACHAWQRRWLCVVSVAAQAAFAASLASRCFCYTLIPAPIIKCGTAFRTP